MSKWTHQPIDDRCRGCNLIDRKRKTCQIYPYPETIWSRGFCRKRVNTNEVKAIRKYMGLG